MLDVFEEDLRRGVPLTEAYIRMQRLIAEPAIAVLLMTLTEDPAGQELLAEWEQRWASYGLQPPWENALRHARPPTQTQHKSW